MKSIKEKELLVNFARSMGQEVDANLVEEVETYNTIKDSVHKSIKENIFKDLNEAFKKSDIKKEVPKIDYPLPPSLDDLMGILNEIKEETNELVQEKTEIERAPESSITPEQSYIRENDEGNKGEGETTNAGREPSPQTLAELTAKFISEAPKDSYQQPDPLVVPDNMDAIRGKLKYLEQWISKISMAGPGGGEVNLRYLDDVYRPNILPQSFLFYNNTINKFDFTTNVTSFVDIENTSRSFGNFYDTTSQSYANVNLGQVVSLGNVGISNNIALQNNGRMVFAKEGNYTVNYSLQFTNSDNQQWDINIWLKKNGNNIVDSNSIFTIPARKNSFTTGKLIATSPISVSVLSNDTVEIYWHTDTNLISLQTIGPQNTPGPDIPLTPSAIVVVSKM